jgi:hypothetical protein
VVSGRGQIRAPSLGVFNENNARIGLVENLLSPGAWYYVSIRPRIGNLRVALHAPFETH